MIRRIGGHTIGFEEMPSIIGFASVAGKLESEGPLGKGFDKIIYDSYDGKNTYEQAESQFQAEAVTLALDKANIKAEEVDYIFDLSDEDYTNLQLFAKRISMRPSV